MTYSWFRAVVAVGAVATALLTPSASYANFFGLFRNHGCCGSTATTTYRPLMVAPSACSTCVPQTVQYAPQVCYRAVTVATPVTTYRPVTACDPCTGCPTTVLRPVTTYVQTVQRVPYTAYRPVCNTGCAPAATTAYYAPPAYYAPTVQSYAPAPAGCSTCTSQSVGYAPTVSYTPPYASPTSYAQPTPAYSGAAQQSMPSQSIPSQSPSTYAAPPSAAGQQSPAPAPVYPGQQPSVAPPETSGQQATPKPALNNDTDGRYEQNRPTGDKEIPMQTVPETRTSAPASGRGLFRVPSVINDPQDQTAQRPRNNYIVQAVHTRPVSETQEELDAEGWRSVRKSK